MQIWIVPCTNVPCTIRSYRLGSWTHLTLNIVTPKATCTPSPPTIGDWQSGPTAASLAWVSKLVSYRITCLHTYFVVLYVYAFVSGCYLLTYLLTHFVATAGRRERSAYCVSANSALSVSEYQCGHQPKPAALSESCALSCPVNWRYRDWSPVSCQLVTKTNKLFPLINKLAYLCFITLKIVVFGPLNT